MRILLTYHRTLDEAPAAAHVRHVATTLTGAGHGVSIIAVGARPDAVAHENRFRGVPSGDFAVWPDYLRSNDGKSASFAELSDAELARYRHAFRLAMDQEIDQWNPDLIHAQHAGVHAQLALETGVPYVCTVWGPELELGRRDERYLRLTEQSLENAGRVLTVNRSIEISIRENFADLDQRIVALDHGECSAERLSAIYQEVLDERFGR